MWFFWGGGGIHIFLKILTKFKGIFLIIEKFGGPWPPQLNE